MALGEFQVPASKAFNVTQSVFGVGCGGKQFYLASAFGKVVSSQDKDHSGTWNLELLLNNRWWYGTEELQSVIPEKLLGYQRSVRFDQDISANQACGRVNQFVSQS